jgi:hypothetical protein
MNNAVIGDKMLIENIFPRRNPRNLSCFNISRRQHSPFEKDDGHKAIKKSLQGGKQRPDYELMTYLGSQFPRMHHNFAKETVDSESTFSHSPAQSDMTRETSAQKTLQ